jgi:anaerobic selenocysteine-containing dehydrogenase
MKRITVCRLCSANCLIEANIDQNNNIFAERIKSPYLKKNISCPKLQAVNEIIYSPDRLTDPLLKIKKANKPTWEKQSWEIILDMIASKLQYYKKNYGAESICWIRGQAPDWSSTWHYAMRFMNLLGSPNIIGNGAICHAAREFAHIMTYGEMSSPDYKNSKYIIVWGRNDHNSKPRLFENILYAKERGAKLIVIDPVKTELAQIADSWLQIKPGGDGLFAMAMMNVIIKEKLYDQKFVDKWTLGFDQLSQSIDAYSPKIISKIINIDSDVIRTIARLYATTKPACIGEGNGLDMNLEVFQTTRAICILRALTGNIDKKGGDKIPLPIPFRNIELSELLPKDVKPITYEYPLFDHFRPTRGNPALGPVTGAIINKKPYPIKVLIIQGTNPVVTVANTKRFLKALDSLDLIIVIDLFMTQTAKYADIVLPTTTSFETTRINFPALYSNQVVLQDKIINSLGNSWPDWKITFELARRMNFEKEFPWKNVEQAIDYQLEPTGITVKQLRSKPEGIDFQHKKSYLKYLEDGFHTPSKKVEILSEKLQRYGFSGLPSFKLSIENYSYYKLKEEYPLLAISGARPNYFVHSQFRNIESLLKYEPEPLVDIHSLDAKERKIENGDLIKIFTPNGSIEMKANVSNIISPGIIRIPWGWGESNLTYNVNNLTDDSEKSPITSTTSNRSFMCNISKSSKKG